MTDSDRELQQWIDEWQATELPGPPAPAMRDYVGRRSRLLQIWLVAEAAIIVVSVAVLLLYIAAHDNAVERSTMLLLLAIVLAVSAFEWWNWRGMLRASAEDTATFVRLSLERLRRVRRAITVSWIVLAAQVIVFTPWIWSRTAASTMGARLLAWGWLLGFTVATVVGILFVRRWVGRETQLLQSLARELKAEETIG